MASALGKWPLLALPELPQFGSRAQFHLEPRYRSDRPLDSTLLKVEPGRDRFVGEIYADAIQTILNQWSRALLRSPEDSRAIAKAQAPNPRGSLFTPTGSRSLRSSPVLKVQQNRFANGKTLDATSFLREWQSELNGYSKIEVAELEITGIDWAGSETSSDALRIDVRIRYEIAGTGAGFYREQRIGNFKTTWESSGASDFRLISGQILDETEARSASPIYVDISERAIGHNYSYGAQMSHGVDYWRTVLDGAVGIDIYGHNGVSAADIDNDGFDDLYVCQPAGLPNRLYRNRGDGTFEDITESSGLGILDNTACALFADYNNDGLEDVVIVRANGPLLYVNEGGGKFRQKPEAFQFANPPQGTFTGAALADYDRDGWLDIYFCLYSYYQGTGQYRYPSPYHDAENGPPNFLMRNNRDGTFRDVTAQSGLNQNNTRFSFACAWNDYNRDGWPDLYVANDFGRKNLYRNNGDGTFTDVAAATKVEDVGAGMSVAWIDFDNDGADDLYVANMWTAAGVRVSTEPQFKAGSLPQVRAMYQKHAMGNSLLLNRGEAFEDRTETSGVRMGRWAWSSDAFDFDHDGFQDLYITNGMISGASRRDLNSFFWRQVVANSPDAASAAHDYEQGWNAINELIRADRTWSGYERNVCYANNHDGTFSDISSVAGLDFLEDSRSFALGDFDHDGRLEICLKNRTAPQVRILRNAIEDLPPSISFRLQGTKSNRDAIGAVITIDTGRGRQTRSVQAGSGFLAQHSKDVFFGLGDSKGTVNASIRWPSGLVEEFDDLPINHRIWIEEGKQPSRLEAFRPATKTGETGFSESEVLPDAFETWLLDPVPVLDFSLPDVSGQMCSLSALGGHSVLLMFLTVKSEVGIVALDSVEKIYRKWAQHGLKVIAVAADDFVSSSGKNEDLPSVDLRAFAHQHRLSFSIVPASDDVAAIYNLLFRQLFDRHRDLRLPTSFLIDGEGKIVKIYQGPLPVDRIEQDAGKIPSTDDERLSLALPFPRGNHSLDSGRNYLSLGTLFFERGYLDQAGIWFQQALRDDPSSAEALYGIGSVYLNQDKNAAARDTFERCVKLKAAYPDTLPDAWNNLGVLATREGNVEESIKYFQQALKLSPNHLLTLNNLGNAYRALKQWDQARSMLERALAVSAEDPEANYSLAMVYAATDNTDQAYEHLERALKARPNYPEALNNLGILYVMTRRPDEAIQTFEQCIRIAPQFDQAYLNLARVYALRGARDKARSVLRDLLQQHPDHAGAKQMLEQLP